MFFQLLSTIKVTLVDEMEQHAYSCVILYDLITIYRGFNLISNSW